MWDGACGRTFHLQRYDMREGTPNLFLITARNPARPTGRGTRPAQADAPDYRPR